MILYERPPIFDEVCAKFDITNKQVVFSWGDDIYNPSRVDIPPAIMAHEAVHGERQLAMGIEAWWREYLDDSDFRLGEEILAYRAEYEYLAGGGNRHQRRGALKGVSQRLSSPIYGSIISAAQARKVLNVHTH